MTRDGSSFFLLFCFVWRLYDVGLVGGSRQRERRNLHLQTCPGCLSVQFVAVNQRGSLTRPSPLRRVCFERELGRHSAN